MKRLESVVGKPGQLIGKYSLDDSEDMLGDLAASSNHADDRKVGRRLDTVYEQLLKLQRSYDDGAWNDSGAMG